MASRPNRTAKKRFETIARIVTKDILCVFVAGKNDSKVVAWNRKKQSEEVVSKITFDAIANVSHKWVMHCAVVGRRQDGQEYMKLEVLTPPHPVTHAQITKSCNELHKEMLARFNKMHQLTAAWIASPHGEELPEAEVDQIITHFGAFEFKAEWEVIK